MAGVTIVIRFVLIVAIFLSLFRESAADFVCPAGDSTVFSEAILQGVCDKIRLQNETFVFNNIQDDEQLQPSVADLLIQGVQANVSGFDASRTGNYESILTGTPIAFDMSSDSSSRVQIDGVKFHNIVVSFSPTKLFEIVNSIFENSVLRIGSTSTFTVRNCSFVSSSIDLLVANEVIFENNRIHNLSLNAELNADWWTIKDTLIELNPSKKSFTLEQFSSSLQIENSTIKGANFLISSSSNAEISITSSKFIESALKIVGVNTLSLIGNEFLDQLLNDQQPNALFFNSISSAIIADNLFRNITSTSSSLTSAIHAEGNNFNLESNIVQFGRSTAGSGGFSAISVGSITNYLIFHNCFFNNEAGFSSTNLTGSRNLTDNLWGDDDIGTDEFLASQVFPDAPQPIYKPVWPSQEAPENCTPALKISYPGIEFQNDTSNLTISWNCSLPDQVFAQIPSQNVILELLAATSSGICFSQEIASISNSNCSIIGSEVTAQNSWTWDKVQVLNHSLGNDFRIRVRFDGDFSFVLDTSQNFTINNAEGEDNISPSCLGGQSSSSTAHSSISSPVLRSSSSTAHSFSPSSSFAPSASSPFGSSTHIASSSLDSSEPSSALSFSSSSITTHSSSPSSPLIESSSSDTSSTLSTSNPQSPSDFDSTSKSATSRKSTLSSSDEKKSSSQASIQSNSGSESSTGAPTNGGFNSIVVAASVITVIFVLLLICGIAVLIVVIVIVIVLRSRASPSGPPNGANDRELLETNQADHPITIQVQALEIPMSKLVIQGKSIGRGAFGEVFKARYQGSIVAFKRLDPSLNTEDVISDFKKEAVIMAQLQHANIIQLYGVCTTESALGIITEFMEKGSLDKLLRNEKLGWMKKICILRDIASGMLYLHSREFLHRDLKPQNILVNQYYVAKISDFGTSKLRAHATSHMTQVMGTPLYMAPEVFSSTYSFPIDIYSFGCICYEVLTEKEPFYEVANKMFIERKVRDDPNFRPTLTDEIARMVDDTSGNKECKAVNLIVHLMQECWQADPRNRPLSTTVLERIERVLSDLSI